MVWQVDAHQTVFRLTAVRLVLRSTSAALPTVNGQIIYYRLQIVNSQSHIFNYLIAACAAASLAIGTLNGEQET